MVDLAQIQETLINNHYQYIKPLGQGGFSSVYLCHSMKYDCDFAVKVTTNNRLTQDEYNALISLTHPNIIKLYDAFEDDYAQYLVMEYCQNGSIPKKKLNYEQFIIYARQLLDALSFCHSKNIAHRDIKPENILIDHNENCKIADFGMAKYFTYNDKSDEKCGSIRFFAPEMFQCDDFDPFKADVWALGITFFCMATGYYPFHGKTKSDIKKSISIGEINFTKYDIDKRIRFLIVKMTQIAPNLRQSPDKLRSLLMFNQPVVAYKKNPSLIDVRSHMTTPRSMSISDNMNELASNDSKKVFAHKNLPTCKCIGLFSTVKRMDRRCSISKPV